MKVTLVTPVFPHPDRGVYPGVERHVYEYALALSRKDVETQILTTFWNGGEAEESFESIKIFRLKDLKYKFNIAGLFSELDTLSFMSLGLSILKKVKILKDSDIVQLHMPISTIRLLKGGSPPFISFFYHFYPPSKLRNYIFFPMKRWMDKKTYEYSDLVIACSSSSARRLYDQYDVPLEKIKVVPLGVNPSFFNSYKIEKNEVREKFGENMLLFVGPLIPRKGLEFLLSAMPRVLKEVPNTKLVLVGDGWQRQKLEKLSKELGVGENVFFEGYVNGWSSLLQKYYSACDVFVFPSLNEGFGMAVVEAMASGKPVIVSNIASMQEVVGDAGVRLKKLTSESISNATIRLLHDEERRRRVGRSAEERVRRLFTWDIIADRTIKIYEEVI